jgi:hypothetical protein
MTARLPIRITDRQLRAFFAIHGYPDPATTARERTIWAATDDRTPTNRICSASSTRRQAAVTVIDPAILKAVQTVYSTDLGLPIEWSDAQRRAFLTAEAEKISSMAASLTETLSQQAITAWSQHRNGRKPSPATTAALIDAARKQATTTVLNNELYELIATDQTNQDNQTPHEPEPTPGRPDWRQRWTNPAYQSDPDEDPEALIDRLWPVPAFSGPFRIKAGWLLTARTEDGLALPTHRDDPQVAELTQMIRADLRTDGLPER